MPNHIINILTFEGSNNSIFQLFKIMKGENRLLDFNNIIPCPNNIYQGDIGNRETKLYGEENCWYNWNTTNWNTKWNAYNFIEFPMDIYHIIFHTAWNEPTPVILQLSKYYSDIVITHYYSDEGENFVGKAAYCNGNILYNLYYDYTFRNTNEFIDISNRCNRISSYGFYRPAIIFNR